MAGVSQKMTFKIYGLAKWLDASKSKESNISLVICGVGFLPDGTLDGRLIQMVRVKAGCEIRSQFWTVFGSERIAEGHRYHCLSEMGYLSDFLPGLYAREHKRK
jgi:hypothetical protein